MRPKWGKNSIGDKKKSCALLQTMAVIVPTPKPRVEETEHDVKDRRPASCGMANRTMMFCCSGFKNCSHKSLSWPERRSTLVVKWQDAVVIEDLLHTSDIVIKE
jgi:hypothetical protein